MTITQAYVRAAALWPGRRIDAIYLRSDDYGYDVNLAIVEIAVRERARPADHYGYHRLDAHGRPVCHAECYERAKALEPALEPAIRFIEEAPE